MYALYPRNNQSVYIVEILLVTCLLPLQKWTVVFMLIVFTIGSVDRCTVDVETTLVDAPQTIEQ